MPKPSVSLKTKVSNFTKVLKLKPTRKTIVYRVLIPKDRPKYITKILICQHKLNYSTYKEILWKYA